MESRNSIDIRVLREVLNRIFDFVEKDLACSKVELRHDYYWSMDADALYSMETQPEELDCGSLVDDWAFIESAFQNPERALPVTLLHVAPIIRELAAVVPSFAIEQGESEAEK